MLTLASPGTNTASTIIVLAKQTASPELAVAKDGHRTETPSHSAGVLVGFPVSTATSKQVVLHS